MQNHKHKLWVEQYRPKTVNDYVFHDPQQRAAVMRMINDKSIPHLLFSGVQGSGKAQPLSSLVLTTKGWLPMGCIEVGNFVVTPAGKTAEVIGIYPQGDKPIYTITFHDGSKAECCLDHLWKCYFIDNYNNRTATEHIVDTKTIIGYIEKQKERAQERFNISIPLSAPVEMETKRFFIHPYLLGVLIGDGSLTKSSPRITTVDEEIIQNVRTVLAEECQLIKIANTSKEYIITQLFPVNKGGKIGMLQNPYTKTLYSVGLFEKRSHEKFVPEEYKTASIEQRLLLLRGLLDTDGTVSKKGHVSYTTTSIALAKDVQEIVWSLGGCATISIRQPTYTYRGIKLLGKTAYEVHIGYKHPKELFTLQRKKDRCHNIHADGRIELRRRIISVEYKNVEEAQCILIDDPEHLYITNDYIVTHNTTLARILISAVHADSSDVLIVNASDERGIDTFRDKIKSFATTMPVGVFKIVLLEEADSLTPDAQQALRRFMEEYADVTRFILTCNYENKVIPPIKSRCQHFHFKAADRNDIAEYLVTILATEGVAFDLDLLDKYITHGYPDIRKIVNMLQQNTVEGKLQSPRFEGTTGDYKFKLIDLIETNKWIDARKLICGNVTSDEWEDLYRFLYENVSRAPKFGEKDKWEEAIVVIAEHLYKHSIVADPEINAAAMFIRLGQL